MSMRILMTVLAAAATVVAGIAAATVAVATTANVALQVGEGWTWCQGPWTWVPQDQDTTVDIDLLNTVNCDGGVVFADEVHDVRGMFIWISPGEFDLDNVRAE
jgi:hypothetical protein